MGLMFKVYAGPWIIDLTIARQHNTNHSQTLTFCETDQLKPF